MTRARLVAIVFPIFLGCSNSEGASAPDAASPDAAAQAACAAPPCADHDACVHDADCKSGRCTANTCAPPTCADGAKNGDETDVDCGGSCPTKCASTKGCNGPDDCVDSVCTANTCAPPTKDDRVKNGNESDVDCGSSTEGGTNTNAPACDAGRTCKTAADCKSGGCNHLGQCAWARSCTTKSGGTTCGTGDSTRSNEHEDCCTSVGVPVYTDVEGFSNATAFRLDKYQITSGRLRRFLDAVGGNVKGWVQTNRSKINAPSQLPESLDPYLPTGWTQPNSNDDCRPDGDDPNDPVIKCNYGALNQISGYRYNNGPGGDVGYGCYMGPGAFGSRTFYLTDAERALVGIGETAHLVPRERVEEKSITCAPYLILASFCAWDGGRLETWDEYNAAAGGNYDQTGAGSGRTYPYVPNSGIFPDPSRSLGFSEPGSDIVGPQNQYGYTPPTPPAGVNAYSVYNSNLTAQQKTDLLLRLRRANHSWNYSNAIILDSIATLEGRPESPILVEAMVDQAKDQSVAVAPPGRYPLGAGRYGHRDLIGNVMEITATPFSGSIDPLATMRWSRNGSFEETSHIDPNTMLGASNFKFPLLTKYARTGGRCARPVDGYPAHALAEGN